MKDSGKGSINSRSTGAGWSKDLQCQQCEVKKNLSTVNGKKLSHQSDKLYRHEVLIQHEVSNRNNKGDKAIKSALLPEGCGGGEYWKSACKSPSVRGRAEGGHASTVKFIMLKFTIKDLSLGRSALLPRPRESVVSTTGFSWSRIVWDSGGTALNISCSTNYLSLFANSEGRTLADLTAPRWHISELFGHFEAYRCQIPELNDLHRFSEISTRITHIGIISDSLLVNTEASISTWTLIFNLGKINKHTNIAHVDVHTFCRQYFAVFLHTMNKSKNSKDKSTTRKTSGGDNRRNVSNAATSDKHNDTKRLRDDTLEETLDTSGAEQKIDQTVSLSQKRDETVSTPDTSMESLDTAISGSLKPTTSSPIPRKGLAGRSENLSVFMDSDEKEAIDMRILMDKMRAYPALIFKKHRDCRR